jgi:hypothetical protein
MPYFKLRQTEVGQKSRTSDLDSETKVVTHPGTPSQTPTSQNENKNARKEKTREKEKKRAKRKN